ncbi:Proposed peptidoglycan lipid II flippase MurJ [hydrothermal vent metagenome]|uniref:Proposed peptidoglycan lipid II flippase MurJ n=1 Tax=hydrothermal vent metagenome TaxID=652676 RepID=A0A3B0ZBZ4_9ZZZZ
MSKKLLKSTATVGSMTLISRVLGLVRDIIFARLFGAGMGADAFFVAFKIPNFFRRLFAEGAFSQAFVPVLSEYKTQREHDEVRSLIDSTAIWLASVLFIVTLICIIAAPLLVMAFAPGFIDDQPKYELTTELLRITFPYLLFISLTALAGGILNTYGKFAVPAFTPVLLNLCLIGAAVFVAPLLDEPVIALAWGVFFAGLAQLGFQLPFLWRMKMLPRPRFDRAHEGVKRIFKLIIPAIFGSSVAQVNLLFDTIIASFLVTGSVSWLYYSDRLVEFPLGVFGIAVATVILPALSRRYSEASPEAFSRTLDWALRLVVIVGLPATVGLFLLAGPMLSTLFQYGAFSPSDVTMATMSLMAYSLGLLGFIFVKVLAPGYYARQDTKTPVKIGIIAMVTNMVLNVLFVVPMVMFDIAGAHTGLALATSVAAFLNAWLLYRGLRRDGVYQLQQGWGWVMLRVLLGTVLMALLLWFGVDDISVWEMWPWWQRMLQLLMWVVAGGALYFAVLWAMGMRPHHLKMAEK